MSPLGPYMVDYRPRKIPHRLGPFDPTGVPMFDPAHIRQSGPPVYHPIIIIQYGLAHFEKAREGDPGAWPVFERCAQWLTENATPDPLGRFLTWPYQFPLRTPRVDPPWLSGMAQGQAISLLARWYEWRSVPLGERIMKEAAQAFRFSVAEGGIVSILPSGARFIEEIAKEPLIHILNGSLYGLLGLYEYLSLFPDPVLSSVLDECIAGVAERLDEFDTGYWSRYSLELRGNLADAYYHDTHIRQLRHLGRLLHRPDFSRRADRWEGFAKSLRKVVASRTVSFAGVNLIRVLTVLGLERLKYRD